MSWSSSWSLRGESDPGFDDRPHATVSNSVKVLWRRAIPAAGDSDVVVQKIWSMSLVKIALEERLDSREMSGTTMPTAAAAPPALTFEEIDDLLYFTRANEAEDLQQTIAELSQKYSCSPRDVLRACIDAETGNTVLHYCSANGFAHLLPSLLALLSSGGTQSQGHDATVSHPINKKNAQGNTPLHWAAYNGHFPVVKMLVEAGADMWIKNQAGHLAMFEAERADKSDVVQYLLEVGGKKVEQGGQEGVPDAAEEVDVDGQAGPSESGGPQSQGGADVDMEG
jgi:uncharacterized protein